MGRVEAITGAVIVGLLLAWGLVVWGLAEQLYLPTVPPVAIQADFVDCSDVATRASNSLCATVAALPVATTTSQGEDPHEGQPSHCANGKDVPAAHKCECKKTPVDLEGNGCDVEDRKCRVYCRKDKCFCFHDGCDS